MTEKRIQFNNIIQNQLPEYVREEFPLVAEFLKQYYISQEFQSAPTDLIQNIDQYIKLDIIKENETYAVLKLDISFFDDVIEVDLEKSPQGTLGFPNSYGLLMIDDEIITYTGKTSSSFTGCIRGFSGVTEYGLQNKPEELLFEQSQSTDHSATTESEEPNKIINLSSLFLKEFFNKIKYQLTPGFENREFYSGLDEYAFLKQSKDFYSTRGTNLSFKILFNVLYGEDVKITYPKEHLIKPSDAQYEITNDLVVEPIDPLIDDPYELENSTLFQNAYGDISSGYAPITNVERVYEKNNRLYYKLSFDSGYNRDIRVDGALYGNFSVHPKTKLIKNATSESTTLDVDSTVGFPSSGELLVTYSGGSQGIITYTSKNINQFFGCEGISGTILDESNISLNVFAYGFSNKNQNKTIRVRITSVLKDVQIIDDTYGQEKGDIGIIKTLGVDSDDAVSNSWIFNLSTTISVSSIIKQSTGENPTYEIITKKDHNLRVSDNIKLISNNGDESDCRIEEGGIKSSISFTINGIGNLDTTRSYTIKRLLSKTNFKNYPELSNQISNVQNVYKSDEKTLVASSSLPSYNLNQSNELNPQEKIVEFSGTFVGDTLNIGNHNFYNGDSVYYIPSSSDNSLFDEGVYYIARIDQSGRVSNKANSDTIKLAKSRAKLYEAISYQKENPDSNETKFIQINNPVTVEGDKFVLFKFYNKKLESQKIFREISPPENDGKEYLTTPGPIGILVNGVEIFNYKSSDKVYYGEVEKFNVISPGFGYDIINPPNLIVSDSVGVGATGYCSVKGSLQQIRIIDPGFDYLETPKINISGGNGSGAKVNVTMNLIDHESIFNSESQVNISTNIIGFSTYHKFKNAEKVFYKTKNQKGVGGISTDSCYYVSIQDSFKVKLHKTYEDALSGINTISLSSYGTGTHSLQSESKKSIISGINIEDSGLNYENKKRTTTSSGISTSSGYINIKNHDFKSGEIIQYSTTGTEIGGLSNNSNYCVTKIDDDNFILSLVGVGTYAQDFYYLTNQYINLTSVGLGTHIFNYPPISVELVGNIGRTVFEPILVSTATTSSGIGTNFVYVNSVSGINTYFDKFTGGGLTRVGINSVGIATSGVGAGLTEKYGYYVNLVSNIISGISTDSQVTFTRETTDLLKAKIQPIFRGEIQSVHLENGGTGYGSSEVINFNRVPNVELNSGSNAEVLPIIDSNGKIVDTLITNSGSGYNSSPNIILIKNGGGVGAVLTPIIENGQLKSIKIVDGGLNYDKNNTFIRIEPAGLGANIEPQIKSWTVNLFKQNYEMISDDDGFISYNPTSKYGLQYSHIYAPRKLRESLYSSISDEEVIYDLIKSNDGDEIESKIHSPIIGWAYDGNPIYGPYGYAKKDGSGRIVQLKSGYKKVEIPNLDRPEFEDEFFVEDYEYLDSDDESILDEYNGRFCVTPEFPNGTYAYFATVDYSETQTSGKFTNYKKPKFPYLIGNKFKSTPNNFNYKRSSNQDDIDLNQTDWKRNTFYHNILGTDSFYSYANLPNDLNQSTEVTYASPGFIENIEIISKGSDYKVNDKILFDNTDTFGFGFSSKVFRVEGKDVNNISVATTTIYNVEIYPNGQNSYTIESQNPHGFNNRDVVSLSGLNTSSSLVKDFYNIGISSNSLSISSPSGISSTNITGIVTYFSVTGNISLPRIKENDVYIVGNEKIKILNVDNLSSRLRVLRSYDGTVGTSHSYSDLLYELPRRFSINSGTLTDLNYQYKINKEIYFNPKESLGVGTSFGVGIGTTITFSNPGAGITQIFIPTKSIYLPNHELETGDSLIYSPNGGTAISISTNGSSSSLLADQSQLYVAKITDDLIGISTVAVGLGSTGTFVGIASAYRSSTTLYLTGIGTNTYHSFKTNRNTLKGQVSKNLVTVSTAQTHGLSNNDFVFVNVSPGISTTIVIKYNDANRKLLVNPISFSSGDVNVTNNTITINNHNFTNGQKVVYNSSSPSGGLTNNQIYYIVFYDDNTIKLANSYFDTILLDPKVVDITSASAGTLSPINPPIKVYKNSTVIFDLSDSSLSYSKGSNQYSAFKLNFYVDSNFTQLFDSSKDSNNFEVTREGRVGIDSTAKVTLKVNEYIPQKLFYKLDLINKDILSNIKKEINVDYFVYSNNQIEVFSSKYNGNYPIVSTSSTTFTYNLSELPESISYSSSDSSITYDTNSLTAVGPISNTIITSSGKNYYSLPKFSNVISENGKNAILKVSSNSVGKIKKFKINDIGFDFASDFTLRPNISFPYFIRISPYNSIETIQVVSTGINYNTSPKLIVLDGKTRKLSSEVDLKYSLGDSKVTILNNTYGLNDVEPIILPTQNSNGVGISSISYNSTNKDVTITLSVGFSTSASFPFTVGDKVLVENISIIPEPVGKGYNSENYEYQFFTIISIDDNIGGSDPTITYNMAEFLEEGEIPGAYDSENSSGRVIPEKYLPTFKTTLKQNAFVIGEKIKYENSDNAIIDSNVLSWNQKNKIIKVSSREIIKEGEIIEGLSSKSKAFVSSIINFNSFANLGAYSNVKHGWILDTGILNNTLQRLQDNFYYQNFSYSLKSRVPYDTWDDAVGSLNHTAGFKKFSDYQLESNQFCGIRTDTISYVDRKIDLDGFASLNCTYDFDLARENVLTIDSKIFSDEITFASRILTDYFESVGNRVLSIDDISRGFDSNPRETNFTVVDRFLLSEFRAQKYIAYLKDRRYANQRQFIVFTVLHDNEVGYINQYARLESEYDMGSFDIIIRNNYANIAFYPAKFEVNDFFITTLSSGIKDNFVGIATTSIGGIVDITTNTIPTFSTQTTIATLKDGYTSSKILLTINNGSSEFQFDELNIIHDGSTVESQILNYGQLNTTNNSYSISGFGTYSTYYSGLDLNIDFIPNLGSSVSVSKVQVSIANTSVSGIGTFDSDYARIKAKTTSILSSPTPSASIIDEYILEDYESSYCIVQVSDITNNRHQLSEIVVVNDENNAYIVEYANIETYSSLGSFDVSKGISSTQLLFTPIPNIDVQVKVYSNLLSI